MSINQSLCGCKPKLYIIIEHNCEEMGGVFYWIIWKNFFENVAL